MCVVHCEKRKRKKQYEIDACVTWRWDNNGVSITFRFTHAGTCDKILKMAGVSRGRSKFLCSRLVRSIRNLSTSRRLLDEHKCVAVEEAESFIERCMRAVGTPKEHCRALSQVLVAGDARGHFSHGLNRLGEIWVFLSDRYHTVKINKGFNYWWILVFVNYTSRKA